MRRLFLALYSVTFFGNTNKLNVSVAASAIAVFKVGLFQGRFKGLTKENHEMIDRGASIKALLLVPQWGCELACMSAI